MMAFFMVMWLINTSPQVKSSVASYFREPGVFETTSGGGAMPGANTGAQAGRAPAHALVLWQAVGLVAEVGHRTLLVPVGAEQVGPEVPDQLVWQFAHNMTAAVLGSAIEERGRVILLVDQSLAASIQPELSLFITNLVGDGWIVSRADVPRHVDDYSTTAAYATNWYNITNRISPIIRKLSTAHPT